MSKQMELIFRLRTEGQEQLRQLRALMSGVTGETVAGNAATDKQTAAHQRAAAAIGAHAGQLKGLSGGLRDVNQAGGMAQRALAMFGDTAGGLVNRIMPLGLGFAGIASSAIAAGTAVYSLAREAGRLAEQQQNVADRTGLTIREVAQFSAAADEAGVGAGALTTAMRSLSHGLSENSDEGRLAKKGLKELGVETENQFGGLKSTRDIWLSLSDAIRGTSDPIRQARLSLDVLGKGGLEMLPLLKSGLRGTIAEMEKMGVGFSEDGAVAALKFDSAVDRLTTRLGTYKQALYEMAAERALRVMGDEGQAQRDDAAWKENQAHNRWRFGFTDQLSPGDAQTLKTGMNRLQPTAPTSADLGRARASRQLAIEERDELAAAAGKKAASHLATRDKQFERLVADLETAGLDPLARLIGGITNRLQELAAGSPLRPGQVAEATHALQGAVRRERMARPIATVGSNPSEGGFLGLTGPAVANNVDVDPNIAEAAVAKARERVVGAMDRQAQHQQRLVTLTTGPGGEVAAIMRVAELREQAAREHFRITQDQGRLEQELDGARYGRVEALEALRQQKATEYRQQAAGAYRAMLQGGGGIGNWGKAAAGQLGEGLFVNASSKLMERAGGALSTLGKKSGIPTWLREGTAFADPLPAASTLMLSASQLQMRAATIFAGAVGGAGSIAQAMGALSGPGNTGKFGFDTIANGWVRTLNSADGLGPGNTGKFGFDTIANGWMTTLGGKKGSAAAMKGVGIAGAAAAGAFGAYSGFTAGGAQGNITGAASLIGAAGAITAMAGATGPAAPIMMGVGMALSAVAMLLGDPKKKFDEKVNSTLLANRYSAPDSIDRVLDTSGFEVDYNYRGGMRANRAAMVVNLTVNALDAQSILDRRTDLGEAIRQELNNDGPLRAQIVDVARYA